MEDNGSGFVLVDAGRVGAGPRVRVGVRVRGGRPMDPALPSGALSGTFNQVL